MDIKRDDIIAQVRNALEPLPYIHALWLEGADASGLLDQYSDLDFWVDFDDDCEAQAIEAVETALSSLAALDFKHVMAHDHPKIRQRVYHLSGTSPDWVIDFCWQLHSRDPIYFIEGDRVEGVKTIFDKSGVIRYKPFNADEYRQGHRDLLAECRYRVSQHNRSLKYIKRGCYLEARQYYNHYVMEPLVFALRIRHTPAHAWLHYIHISHHIPAADARKLEAFEKASTLEEMAANMPQARAWFDELAAAACREGA